MMIRASILGALLLWSASAVAEPSLRDKVQEQLSYIDTAGPTLDQLRRLGPGVDVALQSIAQDKTLIFGLRQRAIGALGALGGPVAQETIEGLLDNPKTPADLLRTAGSAYVLGFRATQPAGVLKRMAVLLKHQDWRVRRTAVEALGRWDNLAAIDLLRKQAAVEQESRVKEPLEKAVAGRVGK
jgi:hypothetical protein